jgi:sugar diacid utilization regulator
MKYERWLSTAKRSFSPGTTRRRSLRDSVTRIRYVTTAVHEYFQFCVSEFREAWQAKLVRALHKRQHQHGGVRKLLGTLVDYFAHSNSCLKEGTNIRGTVAFPQRIRQD